MATASALFILIIGVGLAFFLVPAVDWLEQRGMGRTLASIVCVGGALVVTILLLGAIAIILVEQGVKFVEDLPVYLDELGATYRSLDLPAELRSNIDALVATAQQNAESIDEAALVAGAIGGLMSIVGGAMAWLVLPFFLFYVIRDQPKEEAEFYAGVPLPWKQDVNRVLSIITGDFANYFKAEFIVGGIMFVLVTAGMLIIGTVMDAPLLIEFAFLLGLIALIMGWLFRSPKMLLVSLIAGSAVVLLLLDNPGQSAAEGLERILVAAEGFDQPLMDRDQLVQAQKLNLVQSSHRASNRPSSSFSSMDCSKASKTCGRTLRLRT